MPGTHASTHTHMLVRTRVCARTQKQQCARIHDITLHVVPLDQSGLQVPGAGAYSPKGTRFEQVKRIKGGTLLEKDGQSYIEKVVKRTKDIPGPLDTAFQVPRENLGGRFSKSNVPSNVDLLCRESQKIPGPGTYKTKAGHKRRFTSFTKSALMTNIEKLAIASGKIPGPGAYGEGNRWKSSV